MESEKKIDLKEFMESFKEHIENEYPNAPKVNIESPLIQPQEKNFRYYFGIFGESLILIGMYAIPLSEVSLAAYGLYVLLRYGII
ncbi:MAG TPA: hypothetical protein PK079_00665 [Leptospiraceae bacterium]|nr:hypothetical protein [Leptospiraceae bacterium]HMW03977.1 hypothetical protein [Leptospiraceae bacterium]HMX35325.1 hypothetical protein [Leptospiraceae bacterium]HMY29957.1 hypothetical protein [Leptospiraceae bacterium]HMZ66766.1 hypothetical protein [Leptospiraceae bacterium]